MRSKQAPTSPLGLHLIVFKPESSNGVGYDCFACKAMQGHIYFDTPGAKQRSEWKYLQKTAMGATSPIRTIHTITRKEKILCDSIHSVHTNGRDMPQEVRA